MTTNLSRRVIALIKGEAAETTGWRKKTAKSHVATGIAVLAMVLGGLAFPGTAQASATWQQIVNRQTNECLAVWGGSTAHAANIGVSTCNAASEQLWDVVDGPDGFKYIKVRHTGMCLNVAYYGQANGSDVVQAICSGGTNEQWYLEPFGYEYRLKARHSGKCLDKAWNGDVVQWDCHNGWWQQWRFAATSIPVS